MQPLPKVQWTFLTFQKKKSYLGEPGANEKKSTFPWTTTIKLPCVQFSVPNLFWKLRFGGLLSECQAARFLQRLFFIPLCIHFWCVSDVALHWNKCLTTIKLSKKWLTSPIKAFHVEKSSKKGTKVFAEGIFLCVLWRIIFWPRQRRNVQRICLQSFKAVPLSYLEFFPKEGHSTMMDRHSSSPKSFLSRPPKNHLLLLWIHGMPTRFDGDSAARSAKSWPPVTFAWVMLAWLSARSGCRRPYWQEIRISYVKSSCDVISRDLFLRDSSLFSVECINEKIQFLSKPNQTSTLFLPTCKNWVSYEKSSSKILLLVAVAL